MTQLEQSIAALAQAHNLVHVDIGYSIYDDTKPGEFSVSFQWRDATKEYGRGIATSYADTIAEALNASLAKMVEKRAVALADDPLPIGLST